MASNIMMKILNHKMWKNADIEIYAGRVKLINKTRSFGPVVQTSKEVKPVGYKWVFVRKRNENNKIIRYKA